MRIPARAGSKSKVQRRVRGKRKGIEPKLSAHGAVVKVPETNARSDGATSNFTGPPTNADNTASYGSLGVAAQGSCSTTGNCYTVLASAGTRPLTHWDSTILETVTPTSTPKTWTLHIGDSFTDVPPTNGFYRFIETLLHKQVTGGCGATTYCPTASTTREQMAVFVLRTLDPTLNPPACTTPMFADVLAASAFCRWIEELARRGVVTGCGGGNYCPTANVTREQMSVFLAVTFGLTLYGLQFTASYGGSLRGAPDSSGVADDPTRGPRPFCRWVEEAARRGVVGGCGAGNYCPSANVTREQMSVFLAATFALTLYRL